MRGSPQRLPRIFLNGTDLVYYETGPSGNRVYEVRESVGIEGGHRVITMKLIPVGEFHTSTDCSTYLRP